MALILYTLICIFAGFIIGWATRQKYTRELQGE